MAGRREDYVTYRPEEDFLCVLNTSLERRKFTISDYDNVRILPHYDDVIILSGSTHCMYVCNCAYSTSFRTLP